MIRPPVAVGVAAAAIATALVSPAGPLALTPAVLGLVLLGLGAARNRRGHVTAGAVALLASALLASLVGLQDGLVLLAGLGTVVAWDAIEHAVTLHHQLGPAADTTRAALLHVGATALAGGLVATLAYAALVVARGRLPSLTAVVIVVGAILLALGVAPIARDPDGG